MLHFGPVSIYVGVSPVPYSMATNQCCICEKNTLPLIEKGCACSKTSGLVHIACLVKLADRECRKGSYAVWSRCDGCNTKFTDSTAQKILLTALHFAKFFYHNEKYRKAENVSRRVVKGLQNVLSPSDPDLIKAKIFLAQSLGVQRNYEQMEPIQRDVVETQKKLLGLQHADTRKSAKDLACLLADLGKYKEADKIVREVLVVEMKELGEEHPNTVQSVQYLDYLSYRLGRDDGQPARQHCSGAAPPKC